MEGGEPFKVAPLGGQSDSFSQALPHLHDICVLSLRRVAHGQLSLRRGCAPARASLFVKSLRVERRFCKLKIDPAMAAGNLASAMKGWKSVSDLFAALCWLDCPLRTGKGPMDCP